MQKKWETKTKSKVKSQKLKVKQIIKMLLKNRGLKTKKQISEFLNPIDPYTLDSISLGIKKREINKTIKRIKKAIINKENIVIYGDYDADGICATAIMWETLHSLGAKVMPFIPHREEHGYGLNKEGINSILKLYQSKNLKLLITVDNGIVAKKGVDYANRKNIDVIITDHHQPQKGLPNALAIVWSDQVSGAGVAWFLAKKIYQYFRKNLMGFKASNALELACIGTVTDMMPVLGVNRSLIKYGLSELRKSRRPGIVALCRQAGIPQKEIGVFEIGYIIGPRLNAMGRLEDALESLRLLCTKSDKRADGLASRLGLTNRQRQQLTQTTFEHAKEKSKSKNQKSKIIFISHPSYNPGVIGLVAGKLVEEFYRPAVVISQGKEYSKGSARSIKGFNIIEGLRKFKELFEDIGGHPMAAGFTIETKKIKKLRQKLETLAKKMIDKKLLQPTISIDLEIDLTDINWELAQELEKFSPFGLGNPRPTFVAQKAEVVNIRLVGKERKHLKLKIKPTTNYQQSTIFDAIAFNMGDLAKKLSPGQLIDICFTLEKNVWSGKEKLELKIKDIKKKK